MNNYIMITNVSLIRNEAYMQLLTVDISEEGIANDSGTLLTILLKDRTTNKNIVWASPSYEGMGKPFCADQPIKKNLIIGPYDSIIQPRVEKNKRNQELRTRKRGEVFTPPWLVDKQVSIVMNEVRDNSFERFIALRWLELACGEGPYIVTRYDSITGDIIPVNKRVGFLDRKLQRIAEQSTTEKEFIKWSKIAYESSYGYELQGDSLLLARENLLLSFCEHYNHKFNKLPTMKVIKQIATIVSYNIFQMNGLTMQTPYSDKTKKSIQLNLFDEVNAHEIQGGIFTLIKDWENNVLVSMDSISKGDEIMKFDVVIGNPPYQENIDNNRATPIYNLFLEEAYNISRKTICITPARFLFKAGQTPKEWNKKMLSDKHLQVLFYEQNSSKVFINTDIKGGVAITYRDLDSEKGPIGTFTIFEELQNIIKKVINTEFDSFSSLLYGNSTYHFTDELYKDYPEFNGRVKPAEKFSIGSNSFERFSEVFFEEVPQNGKDYVKIYGRINNNRVFRAIERKYIKNHPNLDKYKVLVPGANGSGAIGEVLSTPLIGEPLIGYTQTFISFGAFDNEREALAVLKYLKTKFARTMLGTLKVTQNNKRGMV